MQNETKYLKHLHRLAHRQETFLTLPHVGFHQKMVASNKHFVYQMLMDLLEIWYINS